jgi:hypothetical protein
MDLPKLKTTEKRPRVSKLAIILSELWRYNNIVGETNMTEKKKKTQSESKDPQPESSPEWQVVREYIMPSSGSPVRRSVVTKSLSRKLQPAQYESFEMTEKWEEIIDWTTIEERDSQLQEWEDRLISNFQGYHDRALEKMKMTHRKAFHTIKTPGGKEVKTTILDNLDTL